MKVFTIGFTGKPAEKVLRCASWGAGVKGVVDVRLDNLPQLAGFARRDDLPFLGTADDLRFVRLSWEGPFGEVRSDPEARHPKWLPFAKGGAYSPSHAHLHLGVTGPDAAGR